MSFADKIKNTSDYHRTATHNYLVHGPAGSGKTHLLRTIEGKVLVGSCESGLTSIGDTEIDYVTLDTVERLREMYAYLAGSDHNYTWAALDSISEMAEMALSEQKARHKDGRRAYGEMAEIIVKLLRAFRELDINVYFTAKQRRDNVDGRLLYIPSMPGSTLTTKRPIAHDFDYVFSLFSDPDQLDDNGVPRRFFRTQHEDYQSKARDPKHVLDLREPAHLGHVHQKLLDSYRSE